MVSEVSREAGTRNGARHVLWARTFGATALDTSLVTRLVESITFTRD